MSQPGFATDDELSQAIGTTSRSVHKAVDSTRRPLVQRARTHIERHIWFEQPFPAADEINALYHDTWEAVQNVTGVYVSFNSVCEHQVRLFQLVDRRYCLHLRQMGSFISRSRSHIVYDVKQHVKDLYKLQGSLEQISRRVAYLLERDRFVCVEDKHQVWLTKAR